MGVAGIQLGRVIECQPAEAVLPTALIYFFRSVVGPIPTTSLKLDSTDRASETKW